MYYMDVLDAAAALYDGGWSSSDRDDLIDEYGLTEEQADMICHALDHIGGDNDDRTGDQT